MRGKIEQVNIKMARDHGLIGPEEVRYEEARDAIKNPENFAKRIEPSEVEISPGVHVKSHTIELGDGNFTNMHDLYFSNTDSRLKTKILTRQKPLYAHRLFVNDHNEPPHEEEPIACINGAFFFLQDEELEKVPSEIIYNLNIRDGKIVGLPASNREALIVDNEGKINARKIEASGIMLIGGKEITWVGGEPVAHHKSPVKTDLSKAVLFNSACCSIEYENPNDKTSLRKLRKDLNSTPQKPDVTDIVVSTKEDGSLYVEKINDGGGTDFFSGNFILQVPNTEIGEIKIGDKVDPKTLGDINLSKIQSAVTTGPDVHHFLDHDDHEINHDPSLGNFPPFAPNARYARSLMYEDASDNIHMVVFDAVPRSVHMKGVTPKEVAQNIPTNVKWAVFLDGGQSSRITFESTKQESKEKQIQSLGNIQYVRLHKRDKTSQDIGTDMRFLWTKNGRPLSSMIALYRDKNI